MRVVLCYLLVCLTSLGQNPPAASADEQATTRLKCRWFFSSGYGRNRKDVESIKALVAIAADHGLNGMVLSSFGLDSVTRWNDSDISLLKELADTCAKKKIELIPIGYSVGYGGAALAHDRNFAAALPTTIDLKVKNGKIVPVYSNNLLINGDLEQHTDNRFKGYDFHDQPGKISFPDIGAASGQNSIRFENFGTTEHGLGRLMQKVSVRAGRAYRFSFKIKTESLIPTTRLKAQVLSKSRYLASSTPRIKATQDWTEATLDFISQKDEVVSVYVGIWNGVSGKFWLDDLTFHEYSDLSDIVRREGTPLELTSRDRSRVFVEGQDFEALRCVPQLDTVPLLRGSSILDGENLSLACYKVPSYSGPSGNQLSLCMSNPKLYESWALEAKNLHDIIPFKKVLLSMDEIRNGGGCGLCRERNISMAEILGDCITRQHAIFKALDPEMEVIIWSDMLDPAHNAHDNYSNVVGDFTGSWKYVPPDLTIMCWHHGIRDQSLSFFFEHGFRTFGAAYYDADSLDNPRAWLSSLRKTINAQGIIYTTWRKKYQLLAEFGDLVSEGVVGQNSTDTEK